jgi:hypothetical protein
VNETGASFVRSTFTTNSIVGQACVASHAAYGSAIAAAIAAAIHGPGRAQTRQQPERHAAAEPEDAQPVEEPHAEHDAERRPAAGAVR